MSLQDGSALSELMFFNFNYFNFPQLEIDCPTKKLTKLGSNAKQHSCLLISPYEISCSCQSVSSMVYIKITW